MPAAGHVAIDATIPVVDEGNACYDPALLFPTYRVNRTHETSVHLSPGLSPSRSSPRSSAVAARGSRAVAFGLLVGLLGPLPLGCATFGPRGPVPEKVAASRQLSREGAAAMEIGQWQQAEVLLQKAVDLSPDDAEARRYLAEALWHRGATVEALSHIRAAARNNPADAMLAVRAGEMSLAVGANDEALARAEQAIRLDPKLATAWALRGRSFWKSGQPDRAMADLQRALEIEPQNAPVLLHVALMYRERGQAPRALTTLHHLLDTYPPGEEPPETLYLEGLTLLDLGRPHQAAESLLAAARRGPPNAEVNYRLAQAYSNAGQYAAATAAAEQSLGIDATHQASQELLLQLASRAQVAPPQRR